MKFAHSSLIFYQAFTLKVLKAKVLTTSIRDKTLEKLEAVLT